MKSIRLALVVFFLFLDAMALLTAIFLAYYTAEQSLQSEQASQRALIFQQFKDQKRDIEERFDNRLLEQARTLPFHFQWNPTLLPQFIPPAGLLTSALAPHGHLLAPVWIDSGQRGTAVNQLIMTRLARQITVEEGRLPHDEDFLGVEYFQINHEWGTVWRSQNLGEYLLPFDSTQLTKTVDWAFDDVKIPGHEENFRRVQFKVPIRYFRLGTRMMSLVPTPSADTNRRTEISNWIVVHCAVDSKTREAQLNELQLKLTADIDSRIAESAEAMWWLRWKLVAIGAFTFIAAVLGGLMLVDIGLSPIRRLSRAVSRVSPKNFLLPISDDVLPRELKPIAQRLRDTLDELRRAFDREKQAVADLSHELRTPVTALLATLDVALRKPRTIEEYHQVIVDARDVSSSMRALVERLLSLAKIDAGVAQIRVEAVDMDDLLADVATLIRPLANEKGLKFVIDATPRVVWCTDPDKLREILVNLLHNAVQYNRPDGSITVRAQPNGERLDITVSDTGIGIDADAIPHIFERFYRADVSREEPALHAGLGLSIVRGYVDLLGGTIGATSNLGTGTTFHLSLPSLAEPGREREAA